MDSSFEYQFQVSAPCSNKRKADSVVMLQTIAKSSSTHQAANCDLCGHADPILSSAACGHTFHSRCVTDPWPLTSCPVCHEKMPQVSIVPLDTNTLLTTRSGKWTKEEEEFVELIMAEFEAGQLPLPEGQAIRLCLAQLLNCSPMRLSKKFQKTPLGKRAYRRRLTEKEPCESSPSQFSQIETRFRKQLLLSRRYDGLEDIGLREIEHLSQSVKRFWLTSFIKFAIASKQPIVGLDVSVPKKRTQVLRQLKAGNFHEFLPHWPAVAPVVQFQPHMKKAKTSETELWPQPAHYWSQEKQQHWTTTTDAEGASANNFHQLLYLADFPSDSVSELLYEEPAQKSQSHPFQPLPMATNHHHHRFSNDSNHHHHHRHPDWEEGYGIEKNHHESYDILQSLNHWTQVDLI